MTVSLFLASVWLSVTVEEDKQGFFPPFLFSSAPFLSYLIKVIVKEAQTAQTSAVWTVEKNLNM